VYTRFTRTRETLAILLAGRAVPTAIEAGLDDVDVGELEGQALQTYRDWRAAHGPELSVPGGESRLAALARYTAALERLRARSDARHVLLVAHDVPIRFLRNALLRADPLDGPVRTVGNLEVLVVDDAQLGAALAVLRRRRAGLPL
jgi:broad specificity phosphatase PhoE